MLMRALRFLFPAVMLLALTVWSSASESTWNYALRYSTFASAAENPQASSFLAGLFPPVTGYSEGPKEAIELSYDLDRLAMRDTASRDDSRPVLQPGMGQYFADDTVGRSLRAGTGLEDPRFFFLKLRVRF